MKLAIVVGELAYGEQLAKGLSRMWGSAEITVLQSGRREVWVERLEPHVVITDERKVAQEWQDRSILLEGGRWKPADRDRDESGNSTYQRVHRLEPLNVLYRRAVEIYRNREDSPFRKGEENSLKIYGFQGMTGGAGTTAIALTAGRLLAMEGRRRVLYTQTQEASLPRYGPWRQLPLRTGAELAYRLEAKQGYSLEDYLAGDDCGLYSMSMTGSEGQWKRLLQQIEAEQAFDTLVVDCGRGSLGVEWDGWFQVRNGRDRRPGGPAADPHAGRVLVNRSPFFMKEEHIWRIPDDEDSFGTEGENVIIALDGAFARGIRSFVREELEI